MSELDPIDLTIFERPFLHKNLPGNCIGCSLTNPIGFHMHFWEINNECWSKATIPNTMCGFNHVAHGGIVTTLLDEVAAYAVGMRYKAFGFTLSANVRFLKPVPTEEEIYIKAIAGENVDNIIHTHAELMKFNGIILADCESDWKIPSIEKVSKILNIEPGVYKKVISQIFNS
jgi:hypothetical protein